ncbi:MAG TPA: hypothetical protein VD794_11610 [Flavisolibacter sp.]|nr:hypothetical protein [Flavisolibacter sp.]
MIEYKVEWILIDLNYSPKQLKELIIFCEKENTTPVQLAAEILGCEQENHILKAPHLRALFSNPTTQHKTFNGQKAIDNRRGAENFFNNISEVLVLDSDKDYHLTTYVEKYIANTGLRKVLGSLSPGFGLCYVSMSFDYMFQDWLIDDHSRPSWNKIYNWNLEYQYYQDGGFAIGGDRPYDLIIPELEAPIRCLPDVEKVIKRIM